MTNEKKENAINLTIYGRRFDDIVLFNEENLSKEKLDIARKYFTMGWHQSILHSINILEKEGEK